MQVAGEFFLSRWEGISLTERTEFTEPFGAHFERTEGLRHTENTEASPPGGCVKMHINNLTTFNL